jgi:Tat protein secretion system quality control protein TatD with DNase activity
VFKKLLDLSNRYKKLAVFITPLERILPETVSPVEYQGKKSEPADVLRTLQAVARVKSIKKERVEGITTGNATEFFDLA